MIVGGAVILYFVFISIFEDDAFSELPSNTPISPIENQYQQSAKLSDSNEKTLSDLSGTATAPTNGFHGRGKEGSENINTEKVENDADKKNSGYDVLPSDGNDGSSTDEESIAHSSGDENNPDQDGQFAQKDENLEDYTDKRDSGSSVHTHERDAFDPDPDPHNGGESTQEDESADTAGSEDNTNHNSDNVVSEPNIGANDTSDAQTTDVDSKGENIDGESDAADEHENDTDGDNVDSESNNGENDTSDAQTTDPDTNSGKVGGGENENTHGGDTNVSQPIIDENDTSDAETKDQNREGSKVEGEGELEDTNKYEKTHDSSNVDSESTTGANDASDVDRDGLGSSGEVVDEGEGTAKEKNHESGRKSSKPNAVENDSSDLTAKKPNQDGGAIGESENENDTNSDGDNLESDSKTIKNDTYDLHAKEPDQEKERGGGDNASDENDLTHNDNSTNSDADAGGGEKSFQIKNNMKGDVTSATTKFEVSEKGEEKSNGGENKEKEKKEKDKKKKKKKPDGEGKESKNIAASAIDQEGKNEATLKQEGQESEVAKSNNDDKLKDKEPVISTVNGNEPGGEGNGDRPNEEGEGKVGSKLNAMDEVSSVVREEVEVEKDSISLNDEILKPCSSNPFETSIDETLEEVSKKAQIWLAKKRASTITLETTDSFFRQEEASGEGKVEKIVEAERRLQANAYEEVVTTSSNAEGSSAESSIVMAKCMTKSSPIKGVCGDLKRESVQKQVDGKCNYIIATSAGVSESAPIIANIVDRSKCKVHVVSLCESGLDPIREEQLLKDDFFSIEKSDTDLLVVHETSCLTGLKPNEESEKNVGIALLDSFSSKSESMPVDLLYIIDSGEKPLQTIFFESMRSYSMYMNDSDNQDANKEFALPMQIIFHYIINLEANITLGDDWQTMLLSKGYALIQSTETDGRNEAKSLAMIKFVCPVEELPMGGAAIFTGAGFPV